MPVSISATERAKGLSAAIAQQVAQQEETLSMSNESAKTHAEDMAKAVAKHVEEVEQVTKRVEGTVTSVVEGFKIQTKTLDELFAKQRAELTTAGDRIDDLSTKVNTRLGQQTASLDQVMERVLSRVKIVEEALSIQTKELSSASDDARCALTSC